MRPSRTASTTRRFSSGSLAELRLPASTPKWRRAATWSRMRAMSGETTRVRPLAGERRQLVAERLACTGRHDGENVLAGEHGAHDLLLPFAEGGEAEDVVENLGGIDHVCRVAEDRLSVNAASGIPSRLRTPFAAAMPVAKLACSR